MLVEVRVRRILILLLLLLRDNRLDEGSMPLLLSNDAHLIVLTADRGLLALSALLEVEKRRMLKQSICPMVLIVHRLALINLLILLVEVWLRRPKTLLMNNALLIIVELPVGNFVEGDIGCSSDRFCRASCYY